MLLIVDDDPTFLERAEELLLGESRGIFFARNAEHAKELLGTVGDGFSVVMIDLDLPGQDGFSLISPTFAVRVSVEPRSPRLRVVTAVASTEHFHYGL